ncbi:MAG: ATP-binding protein [Myxococcales bacterium]|nr:ATP-binding protein [Myxococcales bacterium]
MSGAARRNGSNGNGKDADRRSEVALAAPGPDDVLATVLELSRAITVDMHADEVVHSYIDRFKQLLPERSFCVHLFHPQTGELTSVYATGRLSPGRRERVEITRQALERHGVTIPADSTGPIDVVDHYEPMFVGSGQGFDVPMMDGERIAGLLAVEYAPGMAPPVDDQTLIVQLALQLGSALRNSRLHRESVYLRDYLSKLLDNANAPITVLGRDGEISFVNRAFLALTSFRRDELMGEDWLSLLPDGERRRLLPVYINALRGEPSTNVEVRLPRRDGSVAQVAVNTASILSPDGDVEGVIYIFRDVTELRELEEQVIHAEKLATLGQLAAGVVHELNNPLTSISVYGDYLLKKSEADEGDERDIEKLRRIVSSAERILKFTRDLVTYARPSTERPVPVDVHELVEQAVVFCEHLIDETGARVERNYDESLPPVYGVKGQLVQVFVNLVTNACHAMPLGAGVLTLETVPRHDGRLAVRVRDSGKGITEDNLERIFEPFYTTKGEGKGTGLGLSIVKNIVEQHRGSIDVSSEVGTGTTFEVVLTCRADPRDPAG